MIEKGLKTMKLPYEQVFIEVEKLYEKNFDDNETSAIEDHCLLIQNYIEACGWSADDYMERWLNSNETED